MIAVQMAKFLGSKEVENSVTAWLNQASQLYAESQDREDKVKGELFVDKEMSMYYSDVRSLFTYIVTLQAYAVMHLDVIHSILGTCVQSTMELV